MAGHGWMLLVLTGMSCMDENGCKWLKYQEVSCNDGGSGWKLLGMAVNGCKGLDMS